MGFQPVPKTLSVEFVYWNGQSYAENVFHYESQEAMTTLDLETFAADLRVWFVANIKPILPATIFLSKIIVKDLSAQDAPAIEYTAGMPLPGDNVNLPMPMNVTVAVKLLTGLRGRSYRGRFYYIQLGKGDVTADRVDGGAISAIKAAYEALLLVKWEVGDPGWVVVSRRNNLLPRAYGVTTPITGIQIDGASDSQRRRLLGRGW